MNEVKFTSKDLREVAQRTDLLPSEVRWALICANGDIEAAVDSIKNNMVPKEPDTITKLTWRIIELEERVKRLENRD